MPPLVLPAVKSEQRTSDALISPLTLFSSAPASNETDNREILPLDDSRRKLSASKSFAYISPLIVLIAILFEAEAAQLKFPLEL